MVSLDWEEGIFRGLRRLWRMTKTEKDLPPAGSVSLG